MAGRKIGMRENRLRYTNGDSVHSGTGRPSRTGTRKADPRPSTVRDSDNDVRGIRAWLSRSGDISRSDRGRQSDASTPDPGGSDSTGAETRLEVIFHAHTGQMIVAIVAVTVTVALQVIILL